MKKKYKKVVETIQTTTKSNGVREQLAFEKTYVLPRIEHHKGNITVYIGDVKKALLRLPEGIVDCIVTSPPYWKQRDYKHLKQIGQEDSYIEYINQLVNIFSGVKRVLKPTGTFFLNIGYKYQDKELLLIPEVLAIELQKNGWTLLNKIIWHKPNAMPSSLDNRFSNIYEPVFLFVKKESKYKYYLSLDKLRLPVSNFTTNKQPEDILGLEVENSLFKNGDVKGIIKAVFRNNEGNILTQVNWEDGKQTIELVNDFDKESQIEINLVCQNCGKTINHEIDIDRHNQSLFCREGLKPKLPPPPDFKNRVELKASLLFPFTTPKQSYNGKFKASPDNRGASPGARKSLFGEYLVLQRRYKIFQSVIADYLRFWRKKRNITTKEIDKILGYRDTAGHWFRKDTGSWGRGGSIPLPDDWFRLKNILKFDDIYDRWVTETHLVLQTVKAHPKGKNPGDIWSIKTQPLPEAHFAIFPEELVRKCIEAGCPEGGVVMDPFAGSGTTGKVAQDLKRNAILIELIPEYLNIIKKRCNKIKEIVCVK
jgi:DNA modification methylase